jgi:hypothetical protein
MESTKSARFTEYSDWMMLLGKNEAILSHISGGIGLAGLLWPCSVVGIAVSFEWMVPPLKRRNEWVMPGGGK